MLLSSFQFVLDSGRIVDAVDDVLDLLRYPARRDAVLQVKADLLFTPAFRFGNGTLHGLRNFISIEDGCAMDVARRTPNGLNQRTLRTQEAFLVRIQNRDQRHLGNIQPLTQQIDADQDIELAETKVANNLHPLNGIDIRMQIADLDAVVP